MKKKPPQSPGDEPETKAADPPAAGGDKADAPAHPGKALGVPLEDVGALTALIDSLPVGILIASPEGRILGANQTMLEMAGGYTIEEFLKIPTPDLYVDPADRERILSTLMKESVVRDFEARVKVKDGSTLWVTISTAVYQTPSGSTMLITAIQDITGHKAAEQDLRLTQFGSDNCQEVILRIGPEGNIIYANEYASILHGYSPEEMLSLYVWDLNNDVPRERWPETWRTRKRTRWSQRDTEALRRDGTTFQLEITTSFLEFEGEEYIVVLGRDISERKLAEVALRRSEVLNRTLVDITTDAIIIMDGTGSIVEASENAVELYGADSLDELIGRNGFDLVSEEDRPRALKSFAEALATDMPTRGPEFVATRKDGSPLHLEVSVNLFKDEQGNPESIVAALRNISERKQAERALQDSEERFRNLFESSVDGIVVIGLQGDIIEANQAYLDMLGYTMEELKGLTYADITPTRWHELEMKILAEQVLTRGYSDEYEKEDVRKDGTLVPLSVRRWLIVDEGGNPAGMWSIARDVTERKKYEDELKRMNAELKGFAHTVSHDLRGPLASLIGANKTLQLLLRDPDVTDFRTAIIEMTEIIDSGTARADKLIGDVLSLAETAQVPSEVCPVDVSEVVAGIIADIVGEIEEREIDVRSDADLGTVVANPTHLFQVFSNLIGNAVKHNDSDRPVIEIRSLGARRDAHRYLVRDNGSGIPAEDLEKIFIPFFKGRPGSTGIGLSTVENILSVYGGSIRAYNDEGACFEFLIRDFIPE